MSMGERCDGCGDEYDTVFYGENNKKYCCDCVGVDESLQEELVYEMIMDEKTYSPEVITQMYEYEAEFRRCTA